MNKIPIIIRLYPIISLIETSALQEFCQGYCSNKAQQSPCQGHVQVEIFSCLQAEQSTETDYDYAQYVDCYGSVGCAWASSYPVQAQEAADTQGDIKYSYHGHLFLFEYLQQEPLEAPGNMLACGLDVHGFQVNMVTSIDGHSSSSSYSVATSNGRKLPSCLEKMCEI